ncbi:MAG: glutamate-cysteine ligase family protein [Gemmatimonadota bacterium]|nr:glutamate-cysteine ligase family protein [Gemmatimonadota bacterium]
MTTAVKGSVLPRALAAMSPVLRDRAFPPARAAGASRIGAEVELIAVLSESGSVCPLEAPGGGVATLPFLRRWGSSHAWAEMRSSKGVPSFCLPDGGRVTFEPGGQIEYGAPPSASLSVLVRQLHDVVRPLRTAARDVGIELLSLGIDPHNTLAHAALQVGGERYESMAAYFATIGDAGARMMRQSASIQVCLDTPHGLEETWRTLNAAAPIVVAMFANSPRYGGEITPHQSVRAEAWRALDASRTGLAICDAPGSDGYLDFALAARSIFHAGHPPFGELLAAGDVSIAEWDTHVSTLFPEVRPRGYLEVRSADAIDPDDYAAPLALLAGIAYHGPSLRIASDLLGEPSEQRLRTASRAGLRDATLARDAAALADIAMAGCDALGPDFIAGEDLERAKDFFARYTLRGRAPADDARGEAPRP